MKLKFSDKLVLCRSKSAVLVAQDNYDVESNNEHSSKNSNETAGMKYLKILNKTRWRNKLKIAISNPIPCFLDSRSENCHVRLNCLNQGLQHGLQNVPNVISQINHKCKTFKDPPFRVN